MGNVQDIIEALAGRQPMATAVEDRLLISYDEFQQRWSENINEKIRAGKS
jgi:hypothetical protein